MFKRILMNNGPWGSWEDNNNKGQQPKKPKANNPDLDIDDFVKKGEDFIRKLIADNFGGNGGGNKGGGRKGSSGAGNQKSLLGIIVLSLVVLWLAMGFYKVDPDENAVVLYFGKFHSISTPGLNYYVPYPFGSVIKKSVTNVNTEEFGFNSSSRSYRDRNLDAESLMLTGDENIVDIEFQIQWQISDLKNFIFNISEQNLAIRQAAESAMREIIARTPIADSLSDGKRRIEGEVKVLMQEILDSYDAGVRVVLTQMRRVDPPSQVIDSFRDVQTARADKEKEINQAQSYANDIIPRARGQAAKMKEEAEAYRRQVVAQAEGEVGRFLEVYRQYSQAKRVTKKRIYLEVMEKIYQDIDKIIIDEGAAKSGVVPYIPLNELKK